VTKGIFGLEERGEKENDEEYSGNISCKMFVVH